jgi:hypothetical protein
MAYRNLKRVAAPRPGGFRQPQHAAFVSPTGGWVSAANLAAAPKGTAQRCENFLPTTTGLRMRRGSQKHGTASATDPLESLMAYVGTTRRMFGAADGGIYDLSSPSDPDVVPTASVTGQTSNYYSHINFANPGGNWMLCANGTDEMLVYDGSSFYPAFDTALYSLDYDAETGAFTAGLTVTGGTSGHTGVIVKVIDNGATGTLWLRSTTGTFQNNEAITDSGTGAATADGTRTLLLAALTGVDTDKISHVNVYRNRAWLVEKDTTNAHYLATDAISGAVGTVALSGVFKNGGTLLFSETWSLDAGDGLDDKIVFVSTEGDVAVYQGDPAGTDWSLVGLYECSPPLGKNAKLKVAGDLLLLTKIGVIPLSAIISKDPGALALAAVSRNIQPDWQAETLARSSLPWEMVKWTDQNIAFVTCPVTSEVNDPICFAVNLESGAWSKITGWNTRCMILHDDWVYFGTNTGELIKTEITGADSGEVIYYTYIGQNEHLAGLGRYTTVMQARAVFRSKTIINPRIDVATDYEIDLATYPEAPVVSSGGALWDVGVWDVAQWDTATQFFTVRLGWVSINRSGFAHAPVLQMLSGAESAPVAELIVFEVTHNPGAIVV